ncbi:MAG: GNAT family N-acetyltransferase [Longicatena sp.]
MIDIYPLIGDDIACAQELIWNTFLEYEGADYEQEGIQSFHAFLMDNEALETLKLYGAYEEEQLLGVIATRDNGKHISLFFVEATYQQQGIGRMLWEYVKQNSTCDEITVNSSPYAVSIYHKLGFIDTDKEQVHNGIRFTPMLYTTKK